VTATSDLRAVTGEASSTDGEVDGEPDVSTRSRARFGAIARESATETLRQTRDELLRAVATVDPNAASPSSSGTDAPATVGHADMSERIARLLKVQDAAGDRPLSQVVLRLERPDGGEDRLRVDLRGSTVSATLDVADQAAADHLGANVKELQRALERHGFEAEGLTVRSTSRAAEASTLARAAAVETDLQRPTASSPNTSTNTSSRERGARHDEERPSPDSQRHRSRREHKGDR
jgi:murein L,D-transpeptidase YcbB/YkuD